ncbi:hypothetical protein RND81_02G215100 [Saponaria officinalis]|uniref:Uncharacterized protein n=1 Tax=Saponaria officinalis TaxID=3572 RepID=A0AAW1MWR2_SAPOF
MVSPPPTPNSSSSSPVLHPAFSVENIHNHIKTPLTLQDSVYRTWRHVFTVLCGSYGVQGHINGTAKSKGPDDEFWQRLDYLVFSWIYATISPDLLAMIINPDATAHDTWTAIEQLFHDNKKSRALALLEE